jgi:uroporphyrinogen-III synthase
MPVMLIVRPSARAGDDVRTCSQAGWRARVLSPVEIEPDEAALRGLGEQFSRSDAVFWVSPTAVETAAPYVDFSDDLKVQVAVGQASGRALVRCGAKNVSVPQEGNDSEAVLRLPVWDTLPQGARILIARGRGGRDFLAESLKKKGFAVEIAEVYFRRPNELNWQDFDAESIDAAFIASGELVRGLFAQVPPQFSRFFESLLYFTHHPRIADALREAGARHIRVVASLKAALSSFPKEQTDEPV